MNAFYDIRQLYTPIQPAVAQSNEDVCYNEIFPSVNLQPFIYCYWELKTNKPLGKPYLYNVVADGCIDMFFELQNPENNFVMGFSNKYTQFPLNSSFHFIGIRFLPSVFPYLFNMDASELSNSTFNLKDVIPNVSKFIEQKFRPDLVNDEIKNVLDNYFLRLVYDSDFSLDYRFFDALNLILKNYNSVHIEAGLDTGLSSRQLRRVFQFYIGDSPKAFTKVVRFQKLLHLNKIHSNSQNLFFDGGYYDQSHYIKDFKNLYGITPSKAFKK
jgi:AraC-like DNA-binding protein